MQLKEFQRLFLRSYVKLWCVTNTTFKKYVQNSRDWLGMGVTKRHVPDYDFGMTAKHWSLPFYLFDIRRPKFRRVTLCKAMAHTGYAMFGVEPGTRLRDDGTGRGVSAASVDKMGVRPTEIVSFSCQKPGRPPKDYTPRRRNKHLFSSRDRSNLTD